MISLEQIIEYIKQKYNPLSIILYGSYANGTNNLNSDFDSLVISYDHEQFHDTSFVNGLQLDVFVYPASYFDEDFDCNDFVQIYDGKIIMDSDEKGKTLQTKVLSYLQKRPQKSKAEIEASVDWCAKMLARAKRYDTEGMFRWHWVLIDSLEIFCDIMKHPYFGPKKSLKWMEENHPVAFTCYKKALEDFGMDTLENWIAYLKNAINEI
uniref:nucleotidyltransferase domain-containing protein n=1 Tax=Acetatifactor sp. TaxID=1872090 RepID=UPI0040571690